MSIQCDLLDLTERFNFSDLSSFTQHIPIEWVESALRLSSSATIRRRRLPTEQVLWLVLGMALFRDEPVHEVARRLNICAQGLASDKLLARSGVTNARKRLGSEAVESLFRQTGKHWGHERYPNDEWNGLRVMAVDGALFRTQDTPELRAHFGSGNTSTVRQTPYPMLRLVALMNVRSHKGFWSANLMHMLNQSGQQRHWLIPERKGLVQRIVKRYAAGDEWVEMKVSPQARKKNSQLPETWLARRVTYQVKSGFKTVMTSSGSIHSRTSRSTLSGTLGNRAWV